jgi:hypothetical protein
LGNVGEIEIVPPLSRLEFLLLNWRDWMRRGGNKIARGCPGKACGFIGAGSNSIDDNEYSSDDWHSVAIDRIIYDLPDAENSAIRHQYLDDKYRYLIVFYAATLASARKMILDKMHAEGIW